MFSRLLQRAADHHGDDLRHGRAGRHGVDVATVAQYGDAVGNALDLIHLVRDVDNAHALAFEFADDAKQLLNLSVVERRRGLVHDQHAALVREGFGDFHHLLAGYG